MLKNQYSKDYDVVVAGGGIAGIAAALAASRNGAQIALLEKTVFLGGLATTGMINVYLPLCDGNGTQVTFGICEELLKLSLKYGPGDIPPDWQQQRNAKEEQRYRCVFSPAAMMLALDEVLEAAGVDIWLDTLICDAEVDNNDILRSIFIENSSGRGKINANCFIDATGDALLARRAGGSVEFCENWLCMWSLEYARNKKSASQISPEINMLTTGKRDQLFFAPDSRMVSEFVLAGRKLVSNYYSDTYKAGKEDRFSLYPLHLPAMPQFRKIAAIKGLSQLSDNMHNTFQNDSIGLVADWRKSGFVWEIPYGTLLPQKIKGLLVAGRCISSVGDAWEVTRVIPAAALTGEAAGTAAATALSKNIFPEALPIVELQEKLRKNGNPLHLREVGL